eukprot:366259-Chlamydomonas_euryale.AAC.9
MQQPHLPHFHTSNNHTRTNHAFSRRAASCGPASVGSKNYNGAGSLTTLTTWLLQQVWTGGMYCGRGRRRTPCCCNSVGVGKGAVVWKA